MKSDSVSKPPRTKWRLKRTLSRRVSYRPIEAEDVKYAWAAYKKGGLSAMGGRFAEQDMDADAFRAEFESFVLSSHHAAWTLFAGTKNGHIPVGVVFAAWAPNAPYMIVNGMCWFPWASRRNICESMVNFLNICRKETPLVFYALPEHKRLYEVCAMHGVVRRVGTSYVAIPGHAAAVFETRAA